MYFKATIEIQPNIESELLKQKPTLLFGRFFNAISGGPLSAEEEQQTFTAVEVVQLINKCCRQLEITDIVSLSKDDNIFYYDENDVDDDLNAALKAFSEQHACASSGAFQHIRMGLKHQLEQLSIYIDIDVQRITKPSEAPIQLTIFGFIDAFKDFNKSANLVKASMNEFKDQDRLTRATRDWRLEFSRFVSNLESTLNNSQFTKKVHAKQSTRVVKPSRSSYRFEFDGAQFNDESDLWLYTTLWMDFLDSENLYCSDYEIVDCDACKIGYIDAGVPPTESSLSTTGTTSHEGPTVSSDITASTSTQVDHETSSLKHSSWMSGISHADSADTSSSSSTTSSCSSSSSSSSSSCSSCSS